MQNSLVAAVVAASLACSTGAAAQPAADAEIAAIRAEIAELIARLERLEQASVPPGGAAAAAAPAAAPVAETRVAAATPPALRFSGDLRYRHEAINEEGEPERNRHRIRARFGVTADVTEKVRLGLQLASGTDDPIS